MTDRPPNPFDTHPWELRRELWEAPGPGSDVFYVPQPYQEDMHRQIALDVIFVGGGIGAAKTLTSVKHYAHEIDVAPLRRKMGYGGADGFAGRIAIIGPNYDLAQVAFNYLMQTWDAVGGVQSASTPKNRQWTMVSKTGVEVFTISATDPKTFAARPYTVAHLTEAAQMEEDMFLAALERINRWKMPWLGKIICEGTYENAQPWYPERCKQFQNYPNDENARFFQFRSWDNRHTYPGGWDDPKIRSAYHFHVNSGKKKYFDYRYGGEPPPVPGELWGDWFDPDVHKTLEASFNPALPVDVAFDPAQHRYAILFLQWPDDNTCNVIGELVLRNADFKTIRRRMRQLPWWKNIIAGTSTIVCDRAGDQHHQGLQTTIDLWKAPVKTGGLGLTPRFQYVHQRDQVTVLQNALGGLSFKIRFHPDCKELFSDFHQERVDANGVLNPAKNVGKDDCRKALCYYLFWLRGTGLPKAERKKPRRVRGRGNANATVRRRTI